MPHLAWSNAALRDIDRLKQFLLPKSRPAARRAVKAIRQGIKLLEQHPEIGRLIDELPPEFREWVIEFGKNGYVVFYRFDGNDGVILGIKAGAEDGY